MPILRVNIPGVRVGFPWELIEEKDDAGRRECGVNILQTVTRVGIPEWPGDPKKGKLISHAPYYDSIVDLRPAWKIHGAIMDLFIRRE